MKIKYKNINFRPATRAVIEQANEILFEYQMKGIKMTLRQLYYQFVARGFVSNTMKEYTKLKNIINNARLAGLVDWEQMVDRTRELEKPTTWDSPESIITACVQSFQLDMWATQPKHVEVWIEKEALIGVIETICEDLRIPYFACRGYVSQSSMWEASQRFEECDSDGQEIVILHLGDHDPSGIDMTRDIQERLEMFGIYPEVNRLALNMEQVETFSPPPNPAKQTDSRFQSYILEYGDESWELDALEPEVISQLIEDAVEDLKDEELWEEGKEEEERIISDLQSLSDNWDAVIKYMKDLKKEKKQGKKKGKKKK